MLNFKTTPPDDPRGISLPLKRCPIGKPIGAIVTSHDLIGTPTHFWHGRTHPCTLPDCEPHEEGVPWRWHSYLSAWQPSQKLHFIWESTARATEPFVQYRKANGDLRGCRFTARRLNAAPNSRVMIETSSTDLTGIHLPKAPDLLKLMSIIWNIPLTQMEIDGVLKDVDRVRTLLSDPHVLPIANEKAQKLREAFKRDPTELPGA